MLKHKYIEYCAITSLSILYVYLHWQVIHQDLNGIHLWRQTETQTNIQNFYRYDYNILNPSCNIFNGNKGNIRRYEFPVMQWLIANMYFIFGDKIIVTRLCMIMIALLGILGMYKLFKSLTNHTLASMSCIIIFAFSPLYYFYAVNPMPDLFALVCGIWFFYYFTNYMKNENRKDLIYAAVLISLSILAKLPFAVYGLAVIGYIFHQLFHSKKYLTSARFKTLALAFTISLIPPILWYGWVMPTWHQDTIIPGIFNAAFDKEKYKAILAYHKNILLPEYIFNKTSINYFYLGAFALVIGKSFRSKYFIPFAFTGMMCLIYFFYELNMIDTIHDYYMLPFMVPVYVVALYGMFYVAKMHKYAAIAIILSVTLVPKTTIESTKEWWTLKKVGIPEEWVKYKDELRSVAPKDKMCAMLNDDSGYIMPYMIDKQGYCFQNDNLPMLWVDDMVRNWKVEYLYSNSRKVDSDTAFYKFIEKKVFDKGSMKVFKLKLPN